MKRRKLLTALCTAGLLSAGFGATVLPASAEQRMLVLTLANGEQRPITVDVAPGTPLADIPLPAGLPAAVVGVAEAPPAATATPPAPVETLDPELSDPVEPELEEPASGRRREPSSGDGKKQSAAERARERALRLEQRRAERAARRASRRPDGTPTIDNPTLSLAQPGAAAIGVPNFFIQKFRIPPFLLPIYQAAGIQYGVRWEVLAAINEIETDYGRNLNVSTAGAVGWMQFLPSTWKAYGVDANKDGRRDPYNPVDAIFGAARYLRAAGAETDLSKAIFAYNHADWYVDSVLVRARLIGGLPSNLVGSLTGLTQGHFPVHARARYADDLGEREHTRKARRGQNAAYVVGARRGKRGIRVYARRGSAVVAVNDGRVTHMGATKRLGRFVKLQDVYGNTYTYAHLAKVAPTYPSPKRRRVSRSQIRRELELPRRDRRPSAPATAGRRTRSLKVEKVARPAAAPKREAKQRLFAHPSRPRAAAAGGEDQLLSSGRPVAGYTTYSSYFTKVFGLRAKDVELKKLEVGSRVIGGTILGRIGKTNAKAAPHLLFEIRPAGRGAPRIDPKPILDGWKLLESTAIYRAEGKNPFFGPDAETPSIGQILLMSKEALTERVLANPRVELYACGRRDVRAGQIDRRVLATLEFLAASGLKPTVTSLRCGHGYLTASGNVSHHSSGNAVDIAAINAVPILGHQGSGSVTELAVQRLLTLQGTMKPDQIITLMQFKGTDNTYAMGDHDDHIHVGWKPLFGTNSRAGRQFNAVLKPDQWSRLIDRIQSIPNPLVRTKPSRYALKVTKRGSSAHRGE